jgi:hypothetical protein
MYMPRRAERVFTVEVALMDDWGVWRRIALRGSQTLDHLHWAIYEAFDRVDEGFYSFFFPRPGTRGRARLLDAQEYTSPFALEDVNHPEDEAVLNAGSARLDRLELKAGQTFYYLYDPTNACWYQVSVEEVDGELEPGHYPRILERQGESPPQVPRGGKEEEELGNGTTG